MISLTDKIILRAMFSEGYSGALYESTSCADLRHLASELGVNVSHITKQFYGKNLKRGLFDVISEAI